MEVLRGRRFATSLLLGALLFSASACSGFAAKVCARQESILEAVHEAADYVGPVGHILDQVAGLFLDIFCAGVIEVPAATIDAGAVALGIIERPAAAVDPQPAPEPEG